MYIVTGGAGFIGSHIVRALMERGERKLLVVDTAEAYGEREFAKRDNVAFEDEATFLAGLLSGHYDRWTITAVIHQGACSDTTNHDLAFMMTNNYQYSVNLADFCRRRGIPFLYASSASVYGSSPVRFEEDPSYERPENAYAYSKQLFDSYVRAMLGKLGSQIVGLRYFNVFGPNETHKGETASVVHRFANQLLTEGVISIFDVKQCPKGGQARDFMYVDDLLKIVFYFLERRHLSGIFNCGTGDPTSFASLASQLITLHGSGTVEYVAMPARIQGYQAFTRAELSRLRGTGYDKSFTPLPHALAAMYERMKATL